MYSQELTVLCQVKENLKVLFKCWILYQKHKKLIVQSKCCGLRSKYFWECRSFLALFSADSHIHITKLLMELTKYTQTSQYPLNTYFPISVAFHFYLSTFSFFLISAYPLDYFYYGNLYFFFTFSFLSVTPASRIRQQNLCADPSTDIFSIAVLSLTLKPKRWLAVAMLHHALTLEKILFDTYGLIEYNHYLHFLTIMVIGIIHSYGDIISKTFL